MSRNQQSLLDYEIKRRPDLARLAAGLGLLSEADLHAAFVPLPWMRHALLARKRIQTNEDLRLALESHLVNGVVADPIGEMRRWFGADTYIKVGRSHLEICYGQLVWLDATGVWIDTIHAASIDPLLMQQTESCGAVTRSDYMRAVRVRACQLCPSTTIQAPIERVRFYRPG